MNTKHGVNDKRTNRSSLPYKWHMVIQELLIDPNVRTVSTNTGVPVATIRRWQTLPSFLEHYRRASREHYAAVLGKMQGLIGFGLDGLQEMAKTATDEKVRRDAYEALVRHGTKAAEDANYGERIAAMEAIINVRSQEQSSVPSLMDRLNGLPTPNGNGHANGNGKH